MRGRRNTIPAPQRWGSRLRDRRSRRMDVKEQAGATAADSDAAPRFGRDPMMTRSTVATFAGLLLALAACDDGAEDQAADAPETTEVPQVEEPVGEAVEETGEAAEEAVEETGEAAEEAVEETGEVVEPATDEEVTVPQTDEPVPETNEPQGSGGDTGEEVDIPETDEEIPETQQPSGG